jgi:hypothetical protein
MWRNPAAHSRDFAERYFDDLDLIVAQRMAELGIADSRIGVPDDARAIPWAAFHANGISGGANSPDGRIVVDSGLLNGDLLKTDYGPEAATLFETERLSHRLDAIIAHEEAESRLGDHARALKAAARTELPISERARALCHAMERTWKGR